MYRTEGQCRVTLELHINTDKAISADVTAFERPASQGVDPDPILAIANRTSHDSWVRISHDLDADAVAMYVASLERAAACVTRTDAHAVSTKLAVRERRISASLEDDGRAVGVVKDAGMEGTTSPVDSNSSLQVTNRQVGLGAVVDAERIGSAASVQLAVFELGRTPIDQDSTRRPGGFNANRESTQHWRSAHDYDTRREGTGFDDYGALGSVAHKLDIRSDRDVLAVDSWTDLDE
jgi:hypothetical protein